MTDSFSKTISNNLGELENLCLEVSQFLEEKTSFKAMQAVELSLEEMITNTIKYGYEDQAEHKIEVVVELKDGLVLVTITDDGHEFNPINIPEPDLSKPVEEREIGGLGIHLVRKLTDSINYQRRDAKNILEMKIRSLTSP